MAWRESRSSRRRLGLYMGSISLGVAALVSINSFRANIAEAIHAESRSLLGADLELRTLGPFPQAAQQLLDSTEAAGIPVSYVTNFASMALATQSGLTRLVEVRAVSGSYPYYGAIETDPADRWHTLQSARYVLVDPAVSVQLNATVGDTLAIGNAKFIIDGILSRIPGEVGFRAAFGPRVYIPAAYVEETGLLGFGSRIGYRAFLKFDNSQLLEKYVALHRPMLREHRVRYETAEQREEGFTQFTDLLARFLGMVGLIALLLGGVGVASAVHVFVKNKLTTVAVLRCLGASQIIVFSIYLVQAALLGFAGAAAGVAIGLVVQVNLPAILRDFLPLDVPVSIEWPVLLTGLAIGVWTAMIFALLPLLEVRNVSPLQALRREFEGSRTPSRLRYVAYLAIACSMLGLSVWQAPNWASGIAFASAVAGTTALLWVTAWSIIRATRRLFPKRARYVLRQGIANLYRPHNQTVAVTLAVGFGLFLITVLYVVQQNLLAQIALDVSPDRPSLILFDVQQDQRDSVERLLTGRGMPLLSTTPIVPARISHIKGRAVAELLSDSANLPESRWPLRREYRNTYRDALVASEEIVAGEWWGERRGTGAGERTEEGRETGEQQDLRLRPPPIAPRLREQTVGQVGTGGRLPRISVEEGLATELGVGLGDRITWDVQGVPIETQISSLRHVEWARLEPNFFVVFEPGVLDDAPQTFVTLTRAESARDAAELARDLVTAYPNISTLDLAQVLETIDSILGSIAFAIRFMAFFSIASGMIVLVGAIATSRFQRVKEAVLLRTLGARKRQISLILLTEYSALGILSGFTGILLGAAAGWALVTFFFELTFDPTPIPLVALWLGVAAATAAIGLINSRDVFNKPPLVVIRELGE